MAPTLLGTLVCKLNRDAKGYGANYTSHMWSSVACCPWCYCAVPVQLHRFVRLVWSAHSAMVTSTQGMSFSHCYTGTTYKTAIPVEIKATSCPLGATWIRSPGAKPCYAHAKRNSQWGRAALVAQNPLCSLQTPTPWGWKGHGHHSVISLCHSLSSSLPCEELWLHCSMRNTQY